MLSRVIPRRDDFVPPVDFDVALGEPAGPWNDANNDYNSTTLTGLGDRKPALLLFAGRDSSAAAIAASGLIELSGYAALPEDRARFLSAAEDILECLIAYDGPDAGSEPDYLCAATDTANPAILKVGTVRWGEASRSLIYGDFYFLEALARYEAILARRLLLETQQCHRTGDVVEITFEIAASAPALAFRIERSPDLADGSWATVAAQIGAGPWRGSASVAEEVLLNGHRRVKASTPATGPSGFFRILTRSVGGGG